MTTLLLLEESDGTQTILSEENNIIAENMRIYFMAELGLTVIPLDPKNLIKVAGTLKANWQRVDFYRNEYREYGRTPLRLVK